MDRQSWKQSAVNGEDGVGPFNVIFTSIRRWWDEILRGPHCHNKLTLALLEQMKTVDDDDDKNKIRKNSERDSMFSQTFFSPQFHVRQQKLKEIRIILYVGFSSRCKTGFPLP